MKSGLIGITTFRTAHPLGHTQICLNEAYVSAISKVGAHPILIPLGLPEAQLDSILDTIDGVLFSGGGDANPAFYGSKMHPKVEDVDDDRDRVEIHLAKQVIERRMPFLAICRGLQMVNITLGGTLYEDINDQRPGSLQHQTPENFPRDHIAHTVRLDPNTQLAKIVGKEELPVTSNHHQAVRQIADNLKASAYAADGIIEALEIMDYPFGIAVQWHPEWLQKQKRMLALFDSLRTAAT